MGTEYKKLRNQVLEKTNGKCWYCGKKLTIKAIVSSPVYAKQDTTAYFSIDHIDPQFRNGSDDLHNLVPSCRSCNSSKKYKTLEDYREWLQWKDIGRFTESQIVWLQSHGIEIPEPSKIEFYFEKLELKP